MAYNERLKSLLKTLAAAVFWLLCWQGLSLLVKKPLLLPSPVETAQRLWLLVGRGDFWQSIGMTLLRVTGGFLCGAVCGVLFGALSAKSKLIERLSAPLLAVVKATPVASFIILALVWIQKDGVPVFITFLIVLPVIWNNVLTGIRQTDRSLLEMAQVFCLPRRTVLRRIYAPSVLPYFTAGAATAMGLAWKAGVAAEVIAMSNLSIGYHLYRAKITLETPDLFAWTSMVVLLSVVLERLLWLVLQRGEGRKRDADHH